LESLTEELDDLNVALDNAKDELIEAEEDLNDYEGTDDNVAEDLRDDVRVAKEAVDEAQEDLNAFDDEDENGLSAAELTEILDEVGDALENEETLIPESEWVDYVEEMVKDCGYISDDLPWWIKIDWEDTAENVAMDYSTVSINGEDYYYCNC